MGTIVSKEALLEDFSLKFHQAIPLLKGKDGERRSKKSLDKTFERCAISLNNFSNNQVKVGDKIIGEDITGIMGEPVEFQFGKLGVDPKNFSNNLGGVSSTNISTMILNIAINSYGLNFICLERGMNRPKDEITFTQIVTNTDLYNNIPGGSVVFDSRQATSPTAFLTARQNYQIISAPAVIPTVTTDITLTGPVKYGTFKLLFLDPAKPTETDVVLTDTFAKVSNNEAVLAQYGNFCEKATLNYKTGALNLGDPTAPATGGKTHYQLEYTVDSSDSTGSRIPQLYSKVEYEMLAAQERPIHFDQNITDIVHMNKEYAMNGVKTSDFALDQINKLTAVYIQSLDNEIASTLVFSAMTDLIAKKNGGFCVDFSTLSVGTSNANMRIDATNQLLSNITLEMQLKSGRMPTAYIIDQKAAREIMPNKELVLTPLAQKGADGLIGFYGQMKIPVIMSRTIAVFTDPRLYPGIQGQVDISSIDGEDANEYGIVIGVHKDPSNEIAPIVFGDYLPPYAIQPVSNYLNVAQIRHQIVSSYDIKTVIPGCISCGLIKKKKGLFV